MIAGPSEILVVADRDNDPAWIAADLLSQAEHDTAAQAILITDDRPISPPRSRRRSQRHLAAPAARRRSPAKAGSANGAMIVVADWDEAVALIDRVAPEHLRAGARRRRGAGREQVRHAGAIFLGRYAPEAIGDYVAGPNHVLPTARSARFASGLGVLDFLKRTTLVGCDAASLARAGARGDPPRRGRGARRACAVAVDPARTDEPTA